MYYLNTVPEEARSGHQTSGTGFTGGCEYWAPMSSARESNVLNTGAISPGAS